ncbi:hypothetical protein [Intestinimonas massiliensis (ex Afouda et al. 2020)]|uniref:hypothetical protein n=1 Tax=Intestinimonas massiliensis (ex Afouda et al. 2020) TaxID=1673721 RepID=UPI001032499E|nr:hypothetical protein [Intestinimonas massiliensis (ex Afouda et al. 2020)]
MAAILRMVVSPQNFKGAVSLILLLAGAVFLLRKQPPKRIQQINVSAEDKIRLKNLVGALTVLAALLYPVEVLLFAGHSFSGDFEALFWPVGLIGISAVLMLLFNYYTKK